MQDTLDAVKASAKSFNGDLRDKLEVDAESKNLKVRVKPVFYRDWDDQYDHESLNSQYGGSPTAETPYPNPPRQPDTFSGVKWQWKPNWNAWRQSENGDAKRVRYYDWYGKSSTPGVQGRDSYSRSRSGSTNHVSHSKNTRYYYFRTDENFEEFRDFAAPGGLIEYPAFVDLDPDSRASVGREDLIATLETFLGNRRATGGWDWSEGAGGCLNEAIRSDWYDNQSNEARKYFGVPKGDVVIAQGGPVPSRSHTKITPIPVIVFWTDAPINSLSLSREWLSPTSPPTTRPSSNYGTMPNLSIKIARC